jgi:hypothetical protein
MADTITVLIILFVALNILGVLFFGATYDSKISTLSNKNYIEPDYYTMSNINTNSIYSNLQPTIQQMKSNIMTKLDAQKGKIHEYEAVLEQKRQALLAKQEKLKSELMSLQEKQNSALTNEQLHQINTIKADLKNKLNSISTQLHGVNPENVKCTLPINGFGLSQQQQQARRNMRKEKRLDRRVRFQNDWSIDDPSLVEDVEFEIEENEYLAPRRSTRINRKSSREINECFETGEKEIDLIHDQIFNKKQNNTGEFASFDVSYQLLPE